MKKLFCHSVKRPAALAAAAAMILALGAGTGCGRQEAQLLDVSMLGDLTVVAREEGSGTRSEFESLTGTYESGTDIIASSTEEAAQIVAGDISAIGYTASSSAMPEGVRAVSVDGIAADTETIRTGKYPLCRSYYLVYQGELSDAASDFLTYVMREGQNIVAEYCVPAADTVTFLSDRSSGTVIINGSTSAAPILEELAREYVSKYNPNASIEITATDSGTGLTAAMRGECDFGMSSRELKDYEEELLEKKAIGRDGISVIVNAENPVTSLTIKQIKGIYDGSWEKWSDIT